MWKRRAREPSSRESWHTFFCRERHGLLPCFQLDKQPHLKGLSFTFPAELINWVGFYDQRAPSLLHQLPASTVGFSLFSRSVGSTSDCCFIRCVRASNGTLCDLTEIKFLIRPKVCWQSVLAKILKMAHNCMRLRWNVFKIPRPVQLLKPNLQGLRWPELLRTFADNFSLADVSIKLTLHTERDALPVVQAGFSESICVAASSY